MDEPDPVGRAAFARAVTDRVPSLAEAAGLDPDPYPPEAEYDEPVHYSWDDPPELWAGGPFKIGPMCPGWYEEAVAGDIGCGHESCAAIAYMY